MKDTTEILVDASASGKRLDVFLHERFPDFSRSVLAKSVIRGDITVNQKTKKPSYLLKQNDIISILSEFSSPCTLRLAPCASLPISLLFENEHFLVIDKPAGIQVHPSSAEKEKTVANWLITKYPTLATVGEDPMRPGIVHRLDKDTSGVLVIAKTQNAFSELKKLFSNRIIHKEYLAIVYGVPDPEKGTIDEPIARSASFRKQVVVERRTKWKGIPRSSITTYTLVKEFPCSLSPVTCSLLSVRPRTGRMHQIRVHLASIGHPVVGDKLYSKKEFKKFPTAPRQLLHAHKIPFSLFNKEYTFTAEIPADFKEFVN